MALPFYDIALRARTRTVSERSCATVVLPPQAENLACEILYSVRKSNNIVRTLLEKTMQTADIFFYNQGMKRTRWDDERDFKAGSYPEILRKRRKYHAGDQGH